MTIPATPSVWDRFRFSDRAEPVRLRDREPHVFGYAWRRPAPAASIVALHGLQSHAQWFAEAAGLLNDRNFSVYALDRRGSGSSSGTRGHITAYQDWCDEVRDMVQLARHENPDLPIHLLGHCFGANIALAYALAPKPDIDSVIMLTPGLYVRPDYTVKEKIAIAVTGMARRDTRFRVPQDDELFTRDPDVLSWIKSDSLGARTLTARCLLQINSMLRSVRRDLGQLGIPLLILEAEHDRLSDTPRNHAVIEAALGEKCRFVSFPAEHFLLAEPCRDRVIDSVADWILRVDARRPQHVSSV